MAGQLLYLLVCILTVCAVAAVATSANRRVLIQEAIEEAKTLAHQKAAAAAANRGSTAEQKLQMFKKASPNVMKAGRARALFEDIIRLAEHKMFEKERHQASAMTTEDRAELLAKELLHRPGSKLTKEEIAKIFIESGCKDDEVPKCSDVAVIKHRTVNGECNNLENPLFGAAERSLRRIIPSAYEDGISQPRGAMQGNNEGLMNMGPFNPPNPSARLVSLTIVRDRENEDEDVSHMIMQWGQFIDHDLDEVPQFSDCTCEFDESTCVPIQFTDDDPTFGQRAQECHIFARSVPTCGTGEVEPREQVNEITSFIDGSQVYGSRDLVFNNLREAGTSRLRTGSNIPATGKPSLPIAPQAEAAEIVGCPSGLEECFLAGDVRVNEQTSLTVMHTIWLREHNRIAAQLEALNPSWSADKVFRVTREIVGAEIQKITYKEYLPIVLGDLYNDLIGDYETIGYDPNFDAAVPNGFAAAAYRYGHSQIQPEFQRLDNTYNSIPAGPLQLVDMFFNPSQYEASGGTDPILRGLLSQRARSVDEFVNEVLTTQLFESGPNTGLDLASLNIQRGRDHGLPPYLVWKKWALRTCNLQSEFRNELTHIRLLQTYGGLDSIDLWVGGLAEEPLPGAQVGATFACIFSDTFLAIRHGDRFYYENVVGENSPDAYFTAEQRDAIDQTSLSRVICDNADDITEIQPIAFRRDQARVPCSELGSVDLSTFTIEDGTCAVKIALDQLQLKNNEFAALSFHEFIFGQTIERNLSAVLIPAGQTSACLPIVCPNDIQDVHVTISHFTQFTIGFFCTLDDVNPNLTPSEFKKIYTAKLSQSDIGTTTGAYSSLNTCLSSDAVGVTFTCKGRIQAVASQNEELDEEGKLRLEEFERALLDYKSQHHHTSVSMGHSAAVKGDDSRLMNELEKALKNLN